MQDQMNDVRPALEVEAPVEVAIPESKRSQELFSKLSHDAGLLSYQIYRLKGDLADLQVKMRNTEIEFKKAVSAETKAHKEEATDSKGVTQ